jgi:hypothetical protein
MTGEMAELNDMSRLVTDRYRKLAWALLALSVSGCGGAFDATVNGIVTLDGNVVPRGGVLFQPQSAGSSAYGIIQPDGSYSLHTGREEGLPPGQYVVTVAANERSGVKETKDGGPPPIGKAITPAWYNSPTSSGLVFEVKPGDNDINLELKSAPPPGYKPPKRRT